MNLLQRFKEYIQQNHLFNSKDKLLLAVSGGVDSVVLCELCHQAELDFTIAHCNFQLREGESRRDEQFVRTLVEKYRVNGLMKSFETATYAQDRKLSIQVAARELRYSWFNELLSSGSYPDRPEYLLTAHHLDDNIETLLMNFFKGTGIGGLRGMLPARGKIIRPLLFAKKEELQAFAEQNKLQWVQDSSNESDKYSRNYVRHQLVPLIQKIFPEAEKNLAANLPRFRDIEMLYQQAVDGHKKKLMEPKGDEVHIAVLKLKKTRPLHSVVYEIIKDFGFHAAQVNDVITLLDSDTGKYVASDSHRVIKNRNWLILAPLTTAGTGILLIEEGEREIAFGDRRLEIDRLVSGEPGPNVQPVTANQSVASLDAGELTFPLILRPWKTGDYFYPLGMKKKKKLSRFFIDQKLSKTEKEKIRVLESGKRIAWVIGYRIDDRFKINANTRNILNFILR